MYGVLIAITICYFSLFLNYSLTITFLPLIAEKAGVQPLYLSLIFCFLPIGGILVTIFYEKLMTIFRKRLIYTMIIANSACLYGFLALDHISNFAAFMVIGSITRFIQGFSMGAIASFIYSGLAENYQSKIQKCVIFMEINLSIAVIIGSNIGDFFYKKDLSDIPYILISIVSLIISLGSVWKFKISGRTEESKSDIDPLLLFKNGEFVAVVISLIATIGMKTYILTSLSLLLKDIPNGEDHLGLAYAFNSFGFLVMNVIFFFAIEQLISFFGRNLLMTIALLLQVISLALMAPATFIGLPKNIYVYFTGLFLLGLSSSLFYLPSLPAIIEISSRIMNKFTPELSDVVSSIFAGSMLGSEIIGPAFGSAIFQYIGSGVSCLFFACILLCSFILSLIFSILSRKAIMREEIIPILDEKVYGSLRRAGSSGYL